MTAASHAPAADHQAVETFAYDNRIVRDFIIATLVWGVVGMTLGAIIALQLAYPAATFDQPWFTYGRLRPLHTNAVIFAFACNGIFAGIYYSLQRLMKARMWSDTLSRIHLWGWQAIIVAAVITLPMGFTTSKEYAELEWPIDIGIAAIWLVFGVNFLGTMLTRRERHLYVAVWFYIATWLGVGMLHVVNSLEVPITMWKSYPVYAGVQDALVQWWYGHNAVAFILTTPFLGLMYYFLPKAAERPVYSYRLSIVHFWSLIFIYIWAGPHHLLNSALPEWVQSLAVAFSNMLIGPSWGGMINGLLTLRGAWDKVRESAVLKFFVAAVTFYGMATFEGCLLAVRSVNSVSHNTDWTIAHVHNGALGWVALMIFGTIYWIIPRICRTALWSEALANIHFWLATIGIVTYTVAMWTSGINQGTMQLAFDENGYLAHRDWMEIVRATIPFYWIRFGGGLLFLTGMILCAINIWRTIATGKPVEDDVVTAPALLPESQPKGAQVAEAMIRPADLAGRTDALHALIERWPTLLIVLSAVTVAIGGMCQIIPVLVSGAFTPPNAAYTPYTALELTGRDIYIREGCNGCHTQMVRTLRAETERYGGKYTTFEEGRYDRPFLWGSKRTGPDLAREGVLRPLAAWHYFHFQRPASMAEGSIMPNYSWLAVDDMDLSTAKRKLTVLAGFPCGTPYTQQQIDNAETDARAQAKGIADELHKEPRLADAKDLEKKEVIALIAYIQRLGKDREKADALPQPPAPAVIQAPAAAAAAGK